MRPINLHLTRYKSTYLYCLLGGLFTALLLLFDLTGLMSGSSQQEASLAANSVNLPTLFTAPNLMWLRFLHWAFGWIPGNHLLWSRFVSVILAAAALTATTYLIKRWCGKRTAIFSFFIVACSAWFLHIGRLASQDVAFFLSVPLLICSHLWLHDKPSPWRFFIWLAVNVLLLYVPGMVWLVALNVVVGIKPIVSAWQRKSNQIFQPLFLIWPAALLAPLVYSLVKSNHLVDNLLNLGGLPQTWQANTILHNAAHNLAFIFVGDSAPSSLWLSGLPILDIFIAVMCLVGLIFYAGRAKSFRSQWLIGLAVLCFVLVSLGGPVPISLLLPLLYIFAATGLAYILHIWLKAFPINKLARVTGITLISAALALSCAYNLKSYFLAWPHNRPAVAAFRSHNLPGSKL